MILDLQLNPGTMEWPQLRDGALAAEHAGFGAVFVFDHLSGTVLRGDTMAECFTLLGALAAATTTIGIGTEVVNLANRHHGLTAAGAATAQHISGGRLILGVGVGAAPNTSFSKEHAVLGIELRPTMVGRQELLEEFLLLIEKMWGDERPVEMDGFPRATPRPPIIVGLNSVRLAQLAGRGADGINVRATHDQLPDLIAAANEARRGRSNSWTTAVWHFWDEALLDADHPERHRLANLGVTRLTLAAFDPLDPGVISRVVLR